MNTRTCTGTCGRGKRGHILRRDATRRDAERRIASRRSSKSARTLGKRRDFTLYTLSTAALYRAFGSFVLSDSQVRPGGAQPIHVVIVNVVVVTSRCRSSFFLSFPPNPYPERRISRTRRKRGRENAGIREERANRVEDERKRENVFVACS